MAIKYVFTIDEQGKPTRGTTLTYPDEYEVDGTEGVWNNQDRAYYDRISKTWTVHEQLQLTAPATAEPDVPIDVTASVPGGFVDVSIQIYLEDAGERILVATVPSASATQPFTFTELGLYTLWAVTEHHGSAKVEVTVSA